MSDKSVGTSSEPDPEAWVEKNVPSRLEPYFLFDGERLDHFFRSENAATVKDAVLQIAQIDVLGRTIERLEITRKAIQKAASEQSDSKDASRIAASLEELETKQEGLKRQSTELSRQSEIYFAEHAQISEKISKLQTSQSKRDEYSTIKEQRRLKKELLDQAFQNYAVWAVKEGHLAFSTSAVTAGLETMATRREQGLMPVPISAKILQHILDEGQCVCGIHFPDNPDSRNHIEEMLKQSSEGTELDTELSKIERALFAYDGTIRSLRKRSDDYGLEISMLTENVNDLDEKIAALEKEIATIPDAADQLSRLQNIQKTEADNRSKKNLLDLEIAGIQQSIQTLQLERDKVLRADAKSRALAEQSTFAAKCIAAAQEIYQELSDQVRKDVAKTLDAEFKKMIAKQNYVDRVDITSEFQVEVYDNQGFEVLNTLSAGESECLAFAFSLALNSVSGYELPMVIDTPLGRMSPVVQQQVAESLARNTKSINGEVHQQVILLMTETEYNTDVAKVLSTRKPALFELSFDPQKSISVLEAVK